MQNTENNFFNHSSIINIAVKDAKYCIKYKKNWKKHSTSSTFTKICDDLSMKQQL